MSKRPPTYEPYAQAIPRSVRAPIPLGGCVATPASLGEASAIVASSPRRARTSLLNCLAPPVDEYPSTEWPPIPPSHG